MGIRKSWKPGGRQWVPLLLLLLVAGFYAVRQVWAATSISVAPITPTRQGFPLTSIYDVGVDTAGAGATVRVRGAAFTAGGPITGFAASPVPRDINGNPAPGAVRTAFSFPPTTGGFYYARYDDVPVGQWFVDVTASGPPATDTETHEFLVVDNRNNAPIASFEISPTAPNPPGTLTDTPFDPATDAGPPERFATTNSPDVFLTGTVRTQNGGGNQIVEARVSSFDRNANQFGNEQSFPMLGLADGSPYSLPYNLNQGFNAAGDQGDGIRYVQIRFIDNNMVSSQPYIRGILLDTPANLQDASQTPKITITLNSPPSPADSPNRNFGTVQVTGNNFTIAGSARDAGAASSNPTGSGIETVTLTVQRIDLNGVVQGGNVFGPTNLTLTAGTTEDTKNFNSGAIAAPQSGRYRATIVATDFAGNSATITREFNVDQAVPTATFTNPTNNAVLPCAPTVIRATLTDDLAVAGWELFLDGTADANRIDQADTSTALSTTVAVASPIDFTNIAPGAHTLTVRVRDTAGQTTTSSINITLDNVAPTARLDVPTPNQVRGGQLTVQGQVDDNVALKEWRLLLNGNVVDQGAVPPGRMTFKVSSTLDTADRAVFTAGDGNYTLTLRAVDTCEQVSVDDNTPPVVNQVAFVVDNTAPQVNQFMVDATPLAAGQTPCVMNPTNLTFNAVDTNLDPASVIVRIDGVTLTPTQNGITFTVALPASATALGRHTVEVTAADTAQSTPNTTSATRTYIVDNAVPTALITDPTANQVRSGSLTVQGTLTDDVALKSWQLELDGVQVQKTGLSGERTANVSVTLDTKKLTDGTHLLALRATDECDKSSPDHLVQFIVDNTAPTVTITSPVPDANRCVSNPVTIGVRVTDANVDVNSIVIRLDGTVQAATASTSGMNTDFTVPGQNLTAGEHTITAEVSDRAQTTANRGTATLTFVVDNAIPTANITDPTANQVRSGSLTVQGTVADDAGLKSWELLVDGVQVQKTGLSNDTSANVSATIDTKKLADGAHTLVLRATDRCNKVSNDAAGTATVRFIVDNTAPAITIVSPTPDANGCVSNPVRIEVTVSDANLDVNSVVIRLNGTTQTAQRSDAGSVSTFVIASQTLAAGEYTLTVDAADRAQTTANRSSASLAFVVDAAVPTANITDPTAGAIRSGQLTVQGKVADDTGLRSYQLLLDGTVIQDAQVDGGSRSQNVTATLDTTRLPDGAHTLILRAVDRCAKTSNDTAGTATVRFIVDNTAPAISILSPTPDSSGCVSNPVTIRVTVTDANMDPSAVTVRLNGRAVGADSTAAGNTITYTAPAQNLPVGEYTLTVDATDRAQNTANRSTASLEFLVDNAIPTANLTDPTAGAVRSGQLTIQGQVADDLGLRFYRLVLDGGVVQEATVAGNNSQSITATLDTTRLQDGPHTLILRAVDRCGKASNDAAGTATVRFIVDNAAPSISIVSPAPDPQTNCVSNPVTIRVAVTDANLDPAAVVIRLDGNTRTATTTTQNSTTTFAVAAENLEVGRHTVTVEAADRARATANRSDASLTFIVDAAAPVVRITDPTEGQIRSGQVTIQGTVSDDVGIREWRLLLDNQQVATGGNGEASANVTFTAPNLADGQHTVELQATDVCGKAVDPLTSPQRIVRFTVDNSGPVISINRPVLDRSGCVRSPVDFEIDVTDANLGVVSIQVDGKEQTATRTNQGNRARFTFTMTAAQLPQGRHTLNVRATDRAQPNANSSEASLSFVVDNAPPTARILDPTPNQVRSRQLTVRGQVEDDQGLRRWELLLDGRRLDQVGLDGVTRADLSVPLDTQRFSDGPHTLTLRAVDECDTEGTTEVRFIVDNTAPAIEILQPTPDANGCVPVDARIQVAVTDENLGEVTISVNGTRQTVQAQRTGNRTVFTTPEGTRLPEGQVTVSVQATDVAAPTPNTSSASRSFLVDATPPTVRITAPAPVAGQPLPRAPLTVTVELADAVGLKEAVLRVNNQQFRTFQVTGTRATLTETVPVTSLLGGRNTVQVVATDLCGNQAEQTVEFLIDNTRPQAAIENLESTLRAGDVFGCADLNVSGSMSDDLQLRLWRLLITAGEGDDPTPITEVQVSGTRTTFLTTVPAALLTQKKAKAHERQGGTPGDRREITLTLILQVEDTSGNATEVRRQFRMDNEPPVARVIGPVVRDTPASGVVTVRGEASDNVALVSVELVIDGQTAQTQPATGTRVDVAFSLDTTLLSPGTHQVQLRATDSCGNVGISAPSPVTGGGRTDIRIDNVPPTVQVGYRGVARGRTPTFRANSIVRVQLGLDDTPKQGRVPCILDENGIVSNPNDCDQLDATDMIVEVHRGTASGPLVGRFTVRELREQNTGTALSARIPYLIQQNGRTRLNLPKTAQLDLFLSPRLYRPGPRNTPQSFTVIVRGLRDPSNNLNVPARSTARFVVGFR